MPLYARGLFIPPLNNPRTFFHTNCKTIGPAVYEISADILTFRRTDIKTAFSFSIQDDLYNNKNLRCIKNVWYKLVNYDCLNSASNLCIEINGTHFISNIQHYVCSVVGTIIDRTEYSINELHNRQERFHMF